MERSVMNTFFAPTDCGLPWVASGRLQANRGREGKQHFVFFFCLTSAEKKNSAPQKAYEGVHLP